MTSPPEHRRTSDHLPLVSIGVPVYNGGKHLSEAIESALAQDYGRLEVIVIDNASIDETEAICRRFAAADSRVRYLRSATNLGAITNFRRVLDEARGKYFTWLAHDDVLSEPHYVSTVVGYLEHNPDVVLCASGLYVLDHEFPGSVTIKSFAEIAPDRPWAEARREFFRWPQSHVHHSIYGMIRRESLLRVQIVARTYKRQPTSAWSEMPILTALCRDGRIVALPQTLRAFRSTTTSEGWRTYQMASAYDLFVLGIRTKLMLLRSAWNLPLLPRERASLLGLTVQNLFRGNLSRPLDLRNLIFARARELTQLQRVADERSRLIRSLEVEIQNRRAIAHNIGQPVDPDNSPIVDGRFGDTYRDNTSVVSGLNRLRKVRHPLLQFFQTPEEWQLKLCVQLNDEIGTLRRFCDEQLRIIDRLNAKAASIPETINAAQS